MLILILFEIDHIVRIDLFNTKSVAIYLAISSITFHGRITYYVLFFSKSAVRKVVFPETGIQPSSWLTYAQLEQTVATSGRY